MLSLKWPTSPSGISSSQYLKKDRSDAGSGGFDTPREDFDSNLPDEECASTEGTLLVENMSWFMLWQTWLRV